MNLLSGWFRRRSAPPHARWDLSTPLLEWSPGDAWTIRDAVEGALITGATGAGKTSASGRLLATSFLAKGFGGLVLTAKADERQTWEGYCRETGRSDDLIVFGADGQHRFNALDHEVTRKGAGAGLTLNIVEMLTTMLEVRERASGSANQGEAYWRHANEQLITNAVELLTLSGGRMSVPDLYQVVVSAPTSPETVRDAGWQEHSACFRLLKQAEGKAKSARAVADLGLVADYFLVEWPRLSSRTRSVVQSTFTSMADTLNRGLLRDLFGADTTIGPEAVQDGKVLLIDLPVKEYGQVGLFAQVLWKRAFQRSIERRPASDDPRPVFLWADEAQHFLTSGDALFQTTCRSSRVATVFLTQNVSNVYAALGGGEKAKVEAASLFANLGTKTMHANGDPVTNEWAASLIGRSRQIMANGGTSYGPEDALGALLGRGIRSQEASASSGFSEAFEFEVQPKAFTQLRKGGPENAWVVEGIVFQNGRVFAGSGRSWMRVSFTQKRNSP